ncbi:MAG: hypothetical protein Kow00107_08990 [Planctomycetota bacterium]
MKLHKGLAIFSVRESFVVNELEALAYHEGIRIAVISPQLVAADPEDGKRLCEILRRRGYYPRSYSPSSRSNGQV